MIQQRMNENRTHPGHPGQASVKTFDNSLLTSICQWQLSCPVNCWPSRHLLLVLGVTFMKPITIDFELLGKKKSFYSEILPRVLDEVSILGLTWQVGEKKPNGEKLPHSFCTEKKILRKDGERRESEGEWGIEWVLDQRLYLSSLREGRPSRARLEEYGSFWYPMGFCSTTNKPEWIVQVQFQIPTPNPQRPTVTTGICRETAPINRRP